MPKPTVAFIMPEYRPDTDSHYRYQYETIKALQKRHRIIPVFQRKRGDWKGAVGCRLPGFLGSIELMLRVLSLRMRGVRTFYTHYSYPGAVAAGVATRLFGGKSYYWNCGLVWELHRQARGWHKVREWVRGEIPLRLSLKLSHHLVTGTASMADGYAKNYSLKRNSIVVIPNWVDAERFSLDRHKSRKKLGIGADEQVVLFIHHLSERKGADRLPAIARSLRGAKLYVIGGGPLQQYLAKSATELPMVLLGRVPNKDIPSYMAAADIFIMPSREEGFPRVLLEAMAAGTPFIASPVGGVPDIVPDKSFIALPSEFSSRIAALLKDGNERQRMKAVGGKTARKYTHTHILKDFENQIINAAGKR